MRARNCQAKQTMDAPKILRYTIPNGQAEAELVAKNSVFVGTVGHAPDANGAHQLVAKVREIHPKANHNAWAYRITMGDQGVFGSSDDGEPGGTAGRPMLAVVDGSGLVETVAVVTRYFGGTKLGTGGLVRAYSGAVREALKELQTVERTLHYVARVSSDYGLYANLAYQLHRFGVLIQEEAFTDVVTLQIAIPYPQVEAVSLLLNELSLGDIDLEASWQENRYL